MRSNAVVLLAIIAGAAVAAEPDAIYQPASELPLGRVFLTPGDRERLDRQRAAAVDDGPAPPAVSESGSGTAPPPRNPAAGIILAKGGRPLVWVGGEFRRVDAASIEDIEFSAEPGIRIQAGPPTASMTEAPATASETAGARRSAAFPAAVRVAGAESNVERGKN